MPPNDSPTPGGRLGPDPDLASPVVPDPIRVGVAHELLAAVLLDVALMNQLEADPSAVATVADHLIENLVMANDAAHRLGEMTGAEPRVLVDIARRQVGVAIDLLKVVPWADVAPAAPTAAGEAAA